MDGLGRPNLSTTEDASNNVYSKVSANYDLAGRAYQTSNPYTGGSGSYWTTTQLDVLGRPISTTLPDNSATTYSYSTNTATVTDPTGKKRKSVIDAAGRLSSIYEPDPTNGNSLTLQTSYTYNVMDELTQVSQGSQTRSYVYDGLGRLNSATTPEAGSVCYGTVSGGTCSANGYDNFDNLLYRTDARGVLTSYGYDGLNRLTGISYNVSGATGVPATASVGLTYGTNAAQFNNGRLITMTDGVGSENYSYNSLGQLTQVQKVIGTTTYTTGYAYNVANELTQITYPSRRVVQQSVDPIGRLCEIAPSTTGCGQAASPFATGFGYNAASLTTGLKYGNGVYASFGFSPDRLQLSCLDYSTTNRNGTCTHDSTSMFGLTYSYGSAGSNNGQISGITDYMQSGRSATYTYDSLYRLTNAATSGSTGYPAWGLSESYERYGNRTAQSTSSGCTGITCPTNSVTVSATTNRITTSPEAYDLSGNMTNDGLNTITYDGEGRAVTASGGLGSGTYTYDGNGLRVEKVAGGTTTVYIFSGAKVVAEYVNGAAPSSPTREYIYAGGTLLARIDSSGTNYYHQDHLSNRMVTNSSGGVAAEMGHFPFGESWYNTTNDKLYFTTYECDAESGNHYAMARYHVSRLGRLSSPDPAGSGAANPTDPQSWNRYAYVSNDPADLTDELGLAPPTTTSLTCQQVAAGQTNSTSFGSWLTGVVAAGIMTADWAAGVGATSTTFRPDSVESQQMLSAPGMAQNISTFLAGGKSSGLQTFGAKGLVSAGTNPTAQFVGSYQYSMSLNNGYLNVQVKNTTTAWSFFAHAPGLNPNPPTRTGRSPMGRVNQTFNLTIPCNLPPRPDAPRPNANNTNNSTGDQGSGIDFGGLYLLQLIQSFGGGGGGSSCWFHSEQGGIVTKNGPCSTD